MVYTNEEIREMFSREVTETAQNNCMNTNIYVPNDGLIRDTIFNELLSLYMYLYCDEHEFSIVFLISDSEQNLKYFDVYNDTFNGDAVESIDFVDSALDLNIGFIMQCFSDASISMERKPNESFIFLCDIVNKAVYLADAETIPHEGEVLVADIDSAIKIMPNLV